MFTSTVILQSSKGRDEQFSHSLFHRVCNSKSCRFTCIMFNIRIKILLVESLHVNCLRFLRNSSAVFFFISKVILRTVYYSVSNTSKLGKRKSECSYQESNLRPSDHQFECSTTELQETRGATAIKLGPLTVARH